MQNGSLSREGQGHCRRRVAVASQALHPSARVPTPRALLQSAPLSPPMPPATRCRYRVPAFPRQTLRGPTVPAAQLPLMTALQGLRGNAYTGRRAATAPAADRSTTSPQPEAVPPRAPPFPIMPTTYVWPTNSDGGQDRSMGRAIELDRTPAVVALPGKPRRPRLWQKQGTSGLTLGGHRQVGGEHGVGGSELGPLSYRRHVSCRCNRYPQCRTLQ